ncbi:MAG: CoA pyrophosphatase, partial [Psychrobacter nivimaris]
MTVPENIDFFNKFSVAVPSFIRHPTLRQLAERVQHETLNALTSPAMYESGNTSQSTRILDSLYQTPIADASILVAITHERRPKL